MNDWSAFDRYKLMTSMGGNFPEICMCVINGMGKGAVIDESVINLGSRLGEDVSRIG